MEYTLYKRKLVKGIVYYARFRNPDTEWSSGINTGQTTQPAASAWALNYCATVAKKSIPTFELYSFNFFFPTGKYARTKDFFGRSPAKLTTLTDHQRRLTLHLLPRIGSLTLDKITPAVIVSLQIDLSAPEVGLSSQSVVHIVNTLSLLLKQAVEDGFLDHAPQIRRIAVKSEARGTFTVDEARAIISGEWPDNRHRVINLLAATTGLRQAELLGLRWEAIKDDHVEVFATWSEVTKSLSGSREAPATKAMRIRAVPLVPEVKAALDLLREDSPWKDLDNFVFPSAPDRPIANHIVLRVLFDAMRAAGISDIDRRKRNISFHSWRHFYNSVLVNGRIPLVKLQSIVGHTSDRMTATYYHADDMADVQGVVSQVFKP